jgi:hypothetical protein
MPLALLIALLGCVALFIYALRITGNRNWWRDKAVTLSTVVIAYGPSFTQDTPARRIKQALELGQRGKAMSKRRK